MKTQPDPPLNPEMYSERLKQSAMYSDEWLSTGGTTWYMLALLGRCTACGADLTVDANVLGSH